MDQWPDYLTDESIKQVVGAALAEDIGDGDKTVELLASDEQISAHIVARQDAIICGQPWVNCTFSTVDPSISLNWQKKDGELVHAGEIILEINGQANGILTGERTALNFLQLLSGTATLTRCYADAIKDYPCQVVDTRKTIPGLRVAQKYAVLCGSGINHRIGLYDGILIKENHLKLSNIQSILTAAQRSDLFIEIEVETLSELKQAMEMPCDVIMLDNFSIPDLKKAVTLAGDLKTLEASGNITLENIEAVARTGVQRIAIGAITKNITPTDLSLLVV